MSFPLKKSFVNGQYLDSKAGETFLSFNPENSQELAKIEVGCNPTKFSKKFYENCISEFGKIDTLVNAQGVLQSEESWATMKIFGLKIWTSMPMALFKHYRLV